MSANPYIPAVESLLFVSPQPISPADIKYCIENSLSVSLGVDEIEDAIFQITERYGDDSFGIELKEIAGGYQFLSKPAHFQVVAEHIKITNRKKLSKAAMESLAIIAYKQPISKSEIEQIRGVNSDHSIQKLMEKELVEIVGRSEGPGKPFLLGTSQRFMEYFGLKNMADLPKLKDFASIENEIGEPAPIEETVALDVPTSETILESENE
ncbi:MAG: SMC-Scp complex subunit ScpB [Saprospiraceae bacterium]|nr:SMC-Scp complex subunit ScpB [Saprospiraceae bacterium]MBK8483306.1 SMC-Scp complex subunit ScpB [Saprospiraceae bacterium]MBK9220818.1 SMC-Scp complex subunit ScpB [Saprospiraceae bacterium]MBK9722337.1 SMC-Scp complex subunit ScpB [Saprospiraceae bacterium]MBK9729361.1 SMC-Scp complex subunit ScpB [Saprospiraceae bacterium]